MAFLLSETERIDILILRGYGDKQRSYQEVCDIYNNLHPDKQIKKNAVFRTVERYRMTRSVKNRPRSGRPKSATADDKKLDVLLSIQENAKQSTNQLALDHEIDQKSVRTIFHSEKMHPYKVQVLQELCDVDYDRRQEFCEIITRKIEENPHFISNIVFSDEATFTLHGFVNKQNYRHWAQINPNWYEELHTQFPQKINVWAGLFAGHVIGPFFIDGNLTGQRYLQLLQQEIVPAINNLSPDINLTWYQQDGAPPHFSREVREFLDVTFPNRWIGRRGPIEWPSRSPDLSPLDFFYWGHLKNNVYRNRNNNLEELRIKILNESERITREMILNTQRHFCDNLYHCQLVNGGHFQHLVNNGAVFP